MWKFKNVSQDEFEERKDFVEQIMIRMGAEPTGYGKHSHISAHTSRTIYKYKHEYYRVDEILIWEKPYIIIEWTDRLDYITEDFDMMEDIAPFPYDLDDDQIAIEVASALQPTASNACENYQTNRIAVLAERLYDISIGLKRYDPIKLKWKKQRKDCLHTISIMRHIVQWMQNGRIDENEAIHIVRTLDKYMHPQLRGYQARFLEAHAESDYSEGYYRLLSVMEKTLRSLEDIVENKRSAAYNKAWKIMRSFHNAPRAFLSVSHRMHCSLENARQWAQME